MNKQLSKLGLVQLANNKRILANWVTETELAGKNIHSVYTLCFKCHSWGINLPHNHNCGNCNSTDTTTYYDIDTVTKYVRDSLDEAKDAHQRPKEKSFIDTCKNYTGDGGNQ